MYSVKMKLLPLAIASAILAGCGDATTNIVEKEPIVIKDPHPPVAAVGKGRLLVSDKSSAVVSVYDLDRSELIEQFQLINTPDAVYPSPGQRYAFVVQRPNDRIQLVDGGHGVRRHARHAGKQQVRFLGVVLALGKFVDVEQHRAQHIKKSFRRIARSLAHHDQERLQHGRQRRVFVADDAQGFESHGACLLLVVRREHGRDLRFCR